MPNEWTLAALQAAPLSRLEALWTRPVELPPPAGIYRGHVLRRLDNPTARRPLWRVSQTLAFDWTPFGIDFDHQLWFFVTLCLAAVTLPKPPGSCLS